MIVKYKFEVDRQRRGRKVIEIAPPATEPATPRHQHTTTTAQRLALAYYIERAIETGLIKDYADAARRIGVTRARLTQIMDLRILAPRAQDEMLTGAMLRQDSEDT